MEKKWKSTKILDKAQLDQFEQFLDDRENQRRMNFYNDGWLNVKIIWMKLNYKQELEDSVGLYILKKKGTITKDLSSKKDVGTSNVRSIYNEETVDIFFFNLMLISLNCVIM